MGEDTGFPRKRGRFTYDLIRLFYDPHLVDPPRAASIVFASMIFVFVGIAIANTIKSVRTQTPNPFMHFGPGTDDTNTPSVMGLKIDNWGGWVGAMLVMLLLTGLKRGRNQTYGKYSGQMLSNPKMTHLQQMTALGYKDEIMKWKEEQNLTAIQNAELSAKRKINSLTTQWSVGNNLLDLIPYMLFASTRQLQYLIPSVIYEIIINRKGMMNDYMLSRGRCTEDKEKGFQILTVKNKTTWSRYGYILGFLTSNVIILLWLALLRFFGPKSQPPSGPSNNGALNDASVDNHEAANTNAK